MTQAHDTKQRLLDSAQKPFYARSYERSDPAKLNRVVQEHVVPHVDFVTRRV